MSLLPMLWALKSAPVVDAEERAIIVTLAESAWSDGTDAFPSKKTIADIAKIDPKTVQRRLKTLMSRGLIALGNQAAAAYIPEYFRPNVYDLMIPYSWFPDIEQINAERKAKGKPPLTPEDRPDLPDGPPRKTRADKGRPRKRTRASEEGTTSPRGEDSESPGDSGQEGGSTSPGGGDYKSGIRGLQDPQPSPSYPPLPPSPSSGAEADKDSSAGPEAGQEEGGGGGDAPQREENNTAAEAFVDSLPYGGRRPDRHRRERMIALAAAALAQGWSESALRVQVTSETESAKSLPAVYEHRMEPDVLPAPPRLPAPRAGDEGAPASSRYVRCQGPGCGTKMLPTSDGLCRDCREDVTA